MRFFQAETESDRFTCFELRRIVFIEEQGVSEAIERDSDDAAALHFLALENDTPVAVARVVDKGHGVAKIGRVAVLAARRGEGIGAQLVTTPSAKRPEGTRSF